MSVSFLGLEHKRVVPIPEQESAIRAEGNVLVTGCPGAGKTFVIASAQLNTYKRTKNILGLTFSRTARRKWLQQLEELDCVDDIDIHTFHSFAWNFLGCPELISDEESQEIFGEIVGNDLYRMQDLKLRIDRYKSGIGGLYSVYQIWYDKYQSYLKTNGLLDFNDLIRICLDKIDVKFDRVFIDEGHDTSGIQHELMKKISREVYYIHEPFQRIYSWRDADEQNFQRLITDFHPVEYALTVSHRHARSVVSFLETIYHRGIIAERDDVGLVRVVKVRNEFEEAAAVVEVLKDGMPTLILARERAQFSLLKNLLGKRFYTRVDTGRDIRLNAFDEEVFSVVGATMHSIKGDERFRTIVLGCCEGLVPHRLSDNLIEEKNLFYVACSRAMDELYVFTYNVPCRWLKC